MSSTGGLWVIGKRLLGRMAPQEVSKPAATNYAVDEHSNQYARLIQALNQRVPYDSDWRKELEFPKEIRGIFHAEGSPTEKRLKITSHPEFATAVEIAEKFLNPAMVSDQTKKLVFKSAGEQARDAEQARIIAILDGVRDYGDDVLTDAFGAFLGTCKALPPAERRAGLLGHPDYAKVLENIKRLRQIDEREWRRAQQEQADRAACRTQEYFNEYMAAVEQDLFGNPNRIITHTDRRHLPYRHYAHYQRFAGTLTEKQRFLMLFIIGAEKVGFDGGRMKVDAFTADMYRTSALLGGHTSNPTWEVHPEYNGDNEYTFLGICKECAALDSTDQAFEQALTMSLNPIHTDDMLAVWVKNRLQPHSHGWATSR